MIIKPGISLPGLNVYAKRNDVVLAKRMDEPFVIEHGSGCRTGEAGDWVVLVDGDLWFILSDDQFKRIFFRLGAWPDGCHPVDGYERWL